MTLLIATLVLSVACVIVGFALHDHLEQRRHERELDERIASRFRHPTNYPRP